MMNMRVKRRSLLSLICALSFGLTLPLSANAAVVIGGDDGAAAADTGSQIEEIGGAVTDTQEEEITAPDASAVEADTTADMVDETAMTYEENTGDYIDVNEPSTDGTTMDGASVDALDDVVGTDTNLHGIAIVAVLLVAGVVGVAIMKKRSAA